MTSPVIFQFQHVNFFDYSNLSLLLSEKIAGSATFNLGGELAEQMTGPSFFPTETELNRFAVEASIVFKNYGSNLLEILMGANTTSYTPTAGEVISETNRIGNSMFEDEFISGITINSNNPLRDGLYRIEVTSIAGEVKVTRLSGNEYAGEDEQVLTMAVSAMQDTAFGFSLDAGANFSAVSVALGDVGTFRVLGAGNEAFESVIGSPNARVPKVKLEIVTREMSDGRILSLYIPNAIFPGLNMNFGEEFSENEVAGKIIYDSIEQCIARKVFFSKN